MKNIFLLLFVFGVQFFVAGLPDDEYYIFDKCLGKKIELGCIFSKLKRNYPNIKFSEEKKYSNISFNDFAIGKDIFSVSSYAESIDDAHVLKIEIFSNRFKTGRDVSIGDTKASVIGKYGQPDRERGKMIYYINREYDYLDLIFHFDENGNLNKIELILGT